MHDFLIVGVPLFTILAGLMFNRNEIKDLRSELRSELTDHHQEVLARLGTIEANLRDESVSRGTESSSLRSELRAEMATQHIEVLVRLTTIEADLRQFFQFNGRIEGRLEALEKRS